jgi:uncharacterized protein (DUF1499 family)
MLTQAENPSPMPPTPATPPLQALGLRLLAAALLLVLIVTQPGLAEAALLHLEGPQPVDLGLHQGRLAACPSPAHCSRSEWPVDDPAAALEILLPAVLALDGVSLVETRADYMHATVTSRLFGFVDDLELHADAERGMVEARSMSRLGDSDLGVNARRLESLRQALANPAG